MGKKRGWEGEERERNREGEERERNREGESERGTRESQADREGQTPGATEDKRWRETPPRGEKVVRETHRGKRTERDKNRLTETVTETPRAQGEIKTETGERERNGDPQRW